MISNPIAAADAHFGGVKRTGLGQEGSHHALYGSLHPLYGSLDGSFEMKFICIGGVNADKEE